MSTSASQDSSFTKNTEKSSGTEWILSNPVIDNPIYDFFEEPAMFDTEDHTYTYLIDASILTKSLFSTLPEPSTGTGAELSRNDKTESPTKLDLDAAVTPPLLEGANAELSQNDKTESLDLDVATLPLLEGADVGLSEKDKTKIPTKHDLDAATTPLSEGSPGANAELSQNDKSESSSKNDLNVAATPHEEIIHYVAAQHVIIVETGEDVAENIISFAKGGPKSTNIQSAIGKIAKVAINRRSTDIETHEGLYNIVSLSGSFTSDEVEGQLCVTGGLYISLATDYGISVEGRVVGALTAASQVEVTIRSVTSKGNEDS